MKKLRKSLIVLGLSATAICAFSCVNFYHKPVDTVGAEAPADYYSACEGLTGSSLLSKLLQINKPKSTSYDWSRYEVADEALDDSSSILCLYTRHNIPKNNHCGNYAWDKWNREHIWTQTAYPASASDNHNIFACEGQINNYRGNMPFGEVAHTSANQKDIFGHKTDCYWTNSYFEPCDEAKGEVARSVMYGTVMYSYNMTNEIKSIELALKWHVEHPITERDTIRNDKVYGLQGNRNPFVDHPEYACKIWGNTNDATKKICQSTPPTPTKTLSSIAITGTANKLVYNAGESFQTGGLTVTAIYDDESNENVTSDVSVSPNPLTAGTTSVTLSYTDCTTTKSAIYSGITVNAVTPTNYGTLQNPLSVSQAKLLIQNECTTSGSFTKQPIYCKGNAGVVPSKTSSGTRMLLNVIDQNSTTSVIKLESLNMTQQQYNDIQTGDSIIFHGYGTNNNGTYQFKYNGSNEITLDKNETRDANIPVQSVSIDNDEYNFNVGETCQLLVEIKPSNASDLSLTYSSNNTDIATVNDNGLITFHKAGEVDITVTSKNGKTDCAHFYITNPVINVREINLSESSVSLEVGETKELDYELVPENATDKSVMWTSSNNEVARVSDDGEITAFKAGTATITISTLDKSISDTCLVTVIDKPQPVTKTLVEIVVAKNPDKTTYELNEPYDETGLVIEAHYLDGSSEDVTDQCESNKGSVKTSSVGLSRINYTYKTFNIFVNIYVLDNQPTELKITKNPLKLNYFAEEEFSTIGLEVKAVIGGVETIVTNLVNISYDFESENKFVTIEFGGLTQQIEVTIETGTITVEHKAVDYTYVFEDKLGETAKDKVTLDSWKILEYYYNSLDDATKEALKSVVTAYGNGEVSAAEGNAEKLKECISDYDEIYLLHKDEGFNDFMKRSPKAPTPTPDPTPKQGIDPVILVAIIGGVVVLIILIIVISVSASKKGKKKHA